MRRSGTLTLNRPHQQHEKEGRWLDRPLYFSIAPLVEALDLDTREAAEAARYRDWTIAAVEAWSLRARRHYGAKGGAK